MKQLALSIPLRDHSDFANFHISEANKEAVSAVRDCVKQAAGAVLFLYGDSESGRSHLLEAACLAAADQKISALYLPMRVLVETASPELLQGLGSVQVLAVDDVDAIAGKKEWEEALFHCYNRALQQNQTMIFSSNKPPSLIQFELKDIHSRLGAALIYPLASLNDDDRKACLRKRAANLGLSLSDDVAQYILLRASRSMRDLIAIIDLLDAETLSERRRLTVPFVKKILDW